MAVRRPAGQGCAPGRGRDCQTSLLFEWDHRDPGDRLLAATAKQERVKLWHTGTVLKALKGFPAKYFKAPSR